MVMAVCAIDTFLLITVNIYELLTKCEVMMAGYLAKFCVCLFMDLNLSQSIKIQGKNQVI